MKDAARQFLTQSSILLWDYLKNLRVSVSAMNGLLLGLRLVIDLHILIWVVSHSHSHQWGMSLNYQTQNPNYNWRTFPGKPIYVLNSRLFPLYYFGSWKTAGCLVREGGWEWRHVGTRRTYTGTFPFDYVCKKWNGVELLSLEF